MEGEAQKSRDTCSKKTKVKSGSKKSKSSRKAAKETTSKSGICRSQSARESSDIDERPPWNISTRVFRKDVGHLPIDCEEEKRRRHSTPNPLSSESCQRLIPLKKSLSKTLDKLHVLPQAMLQCSHNRSGNKVTNSVSFTPPDTALPQQHVNLRQIAAAQTDILQHISAVQTEAFQQMSSVQTETFEQISAAQSEAFQQISAMQNETLQHLTALQTKVMASQSKVVPKVLVVVTHETAESQTMKSAESCSQTSISPDTLLPHVEMQQRKSASQQTEMYRQASCSSNTDLCSQNSSSQTELPPEILQTRNERRQQRSAVQQTIMPSQTSCSSNTEMDVNSFASQTEISPGSFEPHREVKQQKMASEQTGISPQTYYNSNTEMDANNLAIQIKVPPEISISIAQMPQNNIVPQLESQPEITSLPKSPQELLQYVPSNNSSLQNQVLPENSTSQAEVQLEISIPQVEENPEDLDSSSSETQSMLSTSEAEVSPEEYSILQIKVSPEILPSQAVEKVQGNLVLQKRVPQESSQERVSQTLLKQKNTNSRTELQPVISTSDTMSDKSTQSSTDALISMLIAYATDDEYEEMSPRITKDLSFESSPFEVEKTECDSISSASSRNSNTTAITSKHRGVLISSISLPLIVSQARVSSNIPDTKSEPALMLSRSSHTDCKQNYLIDADEMPENSKSSFEVQLDVSNSQANVPLKNFTSQYELPLEISATQVKNNLGDLKFSSELALDIQIFQQEVPQELSTFQADISISQEAEVLQKKLVSQEQIPLKSSQAEILPDLSASNTKVPASKSVDMIRKRDHTQTSSFSWLPDNMQTSQVEDPNEFLSSELQYQAEILASQIEKMSESSDVSSEQDAELSATKNKVPSKISSKNNSESSLEIQSKSLSDILLEILKSKSPPEDTASPNKTLLENTVSPTDVLPDSFIPQTSLKLNSVQSKMQSEIPTSNRMSGSSTQRSTDAIIDTVLEHVKDRGYEDTGPNITSKLGFTSNPKYEGRKSVPNRASACRNVDTGMIVNHTGVPLHGTSLTNMPKTLSTRQVGVLPKIPASKSEFLPKLSKALQADIPLLNLPIADKMPENSISSSEKQAEISISQTSVPCGVLASEIDNNAEDLEDSLSKEERLSEVSSVLAKFIVKWITSPLEMLSEDMTSEAELSKAQMDNSPDVQTSKAGLSKVKMDNSPDVQTSEARFSKAQMDNSPDIRTSNLAEPMQENLVSHYEISSIDYEMPTEYLTSRTEILPKIKTSSVELLPMGPIPPTATQSKSINSRAELRPEVSNSDRMSENSSLRSTDVLLSMLTAYGTDEEFEEMSPKHSKGLSSPSSANVGEENVEHHLEPSETGRSVDMQMEVGYHRLSSFTASSENGETTEFSVNIEQHVPFLYKVESYLAGMADGTTYGENKESGVCGFCTSRKEQSIDMEGPAVSSNSSGIYSRSICKSDYERSSFMPSTTTATEVAVIKKKTEEDKSNPLEGSSSCSCKRNDHKTNQLSDPAASNDLEEK